MGFSVVNWGMLLRLKKGTTGKFEKMKEVKAVDCFDSDSTTFE